MKTILLFTAIIFATVNAWSFEAGYIDMQKAIQSTSSGKKAKQELESEFNKKKDSLKKKEDELKKMKDDFEKKAAVLSDEVKAKKAGELQQEFMKFQQDLSQSQMNIQKKEMELTAPIVKKIQSVIEKVAKEKGFAMVFQKSEQNVMWAKPELDITEQVIKEFEKK